MSLTRVCLREAAFKLRECNGSEPAGPVSCKLDRPLSSSTESPCL